MEKLTPKRKQKYFRKDRGWLFLNGIVYSVFGIYAVKELLVNSKTTMDYVLNGIFLVATLFASLIYWKALNMCFIVLHDRIKIKGWWQEIDILFKDIEKCDFHSPNYSESCILYLKRPLPSIFRFSNLPLAVLEKDRKAIALSPFLNKQDWDEFEKTICPRN